jgi:hypothetical protein
MLKANVLLSLGKQEEKVIVDGYINGTAVSDIDVGDIDIGVEVI